MELSFKLKNRVWPTSLLQGFGLLWFLLLMSWSEVRAQAPVFGSLTENLNLEIENLPGASGNIYTSPSPSEGSLIADCVDKIVAGKYDEAHQLATQFQYQVVRFIDNTQAQNRLFIVLKKLNTGTHHWGTFVFNPNACKPLVIQCPHPRFDTNTGYQGAFVFNQLEPAALMIAGTHRCNHSFATSCSGTTTACGTNQVYRISDVAHNDQSAFNYVSAKLADLWTGHYFIQLHGFAKGSGDPSLIISNGTRTTPETDKIIELENDLKELNGSVSFKTVHIDLSWTKLTAFTNVQGRYLNDSSDPCTRDASLATGRFIHIEQELEMFRRNASGWKLMADALQKTFACINTTVTEWDNTLEINVLDDYLEVSSDKPDAYKVQFYDISGKLISQTEGKGNALLPLPSVNITYLRLISKDSGKLLFSKIISYVR